LKNYKVLAADEEAMKVASDTFFRQFVEWMNSKSIENAGRLQEAAEVVRTEFLQKGDWYNALVDSIAQYLRTIPANESLYSVAEGLADRIVGIESDRDSIDNLDLTVRTYNCLKRAGVETVSQLRKMSAVDFANVRNFNQRCIDEVEEKLEDYQY
jgi:DNA-directed RNA polymerase alpha subunit